MVFVSEKSIHFEREDLSDSLLYMWLFHSFSVESVWENYLKKYFVKPFC